MTKDNANFRSEFHQKKKKKKNFRSEDKAWAIKQYDLSKSHAKHTTLANIFQPLQFSKFSS